MSERTLYDKVWDAHTVTTLPTGQTQLFIGLHLVHEVTTPQAFDMMRERGLSIAYPQRTFATADHIVPTDTHARPFADHQAEAMMAALGRRTSATLASSSTVWVVTGRASFMSSVRSSV